MIPEPKESIILAVNGESRETRAHTVSELLEELGLHERRCATMVNGTIVRRQDRETQTLQPGDQVDVISMVGGG